MFFKVIRISLKGRLFEISLIPYNMVNKFSDLMADKIPAKAGMTLIHEILVIKKYLL